MSLCSRGSTGEPPAEREIAFHGTLSPLHALNDGLKASPTQGCARGHICLAERPEVAANFGTVLEVDVRDLDVVWEQGEGRFHGDIAPERLRGYGYAPRPDWQGWSDPALRINHRACLSPAERESLVEATRAHQMQLEALRRDPDNEELQEDLGKAQAELMNAWVQR